MSLKHPILHIVVQYPSPSSHLLSPCSYDYTTLYGFHIQSFQSSIASQRAKTETSQSGIVAYVFVNKHWIFMGNFFSTAGSEDLDLCLWPPKSIILRSLKKSVDYPQLLNYPSIRLSKSKEILCSVDTVLCISRYHIVSTKSISITQKHIKKRQQIMQK